MELKQAPILVTGATGFIGAYLLHALIRQGYTNVRAIRRPSSSMALVADVADKVQWFEADLLDVADLGEAMKGVRRVFHVAAVVSFSARHRQKMKLVNVEGTANVVNLALAEGVEKLVHVSSIAALGRPRDGGLIDENTPWRPETVTSHYGLTKHLAEMEVWRGLAEGLNAAVVNPANVLGSGFWRERTGTAQVFYHIYRGLKFYPLGANAFVDVRDVVRFMIRLMESERSGERFILAAENLPFKAVFDSIARHLGVPPPSIPVTPLLRELAWRGAWLWSKISGQPQFITRENVRLSAATYRYDNSRSLACFPDFAYTPIETTIRQTAAQFLQCAEKGFPPALLPFE